MAADNFFSRWSKRKDENDAAPSEDVREGAIASGAAHQPEAAPVQPAEPKPLPTMEDVANLTPDSDYSAFVAKGVDENVKRSALKKLFANFNAMDGLDVYIDDYNKFTPLSAAMLASLNHAKDLLDPMRKFQQPVMQMMENPAESELPPPKAEVEEPESGHENAEAQQQRPEQEPLAQAASEPAVQAETAPENGSGDDNENLSQSNQ